MKKSVWLLTLVLAACTSPVTVTPEPTLEATLPRPTEVVNVPSATPIPPTATATALPPTATSVPPTPTSTPRPLPTPLSDWSDLTPYRAAMRPEFAADVDQFAKATQYLIDLAIAPDLASYTAVQQVHFVNRQTKPLDKIYFRLFPNAETYGGQLTITSLQVNGVQIKPVLEVKNTALRINLDPPLKPRASVDFVFRYEGQVPTTLNDAGYNLFVSYSNTLSLANFYPLIPAYDEQGWHIEPAPQYGDAGYSETALYQVNIEAQADQVVATSGVCEATDNGATKTWHCVSGPMRDFMLAMSADYQVESRDVADVKVNSYFWENDEAGGQLILQSGASSLKSFEKRIGAYPFNEMDLVETPMTAGGCEYPGLMIFRADYYSYLDDTLATHEVAHQWWYSLVGNDQVNEPWLDEALASFVTNLWTLDEKGQEVFQNITKIYQSRYRETESTADNRRVDLPQTDYASPTQYTRNVYVKGLLFFNALYEKMGDEKFNQFLQTYFKANRYGIAHKDDLLKAITTQIDQRTLTALLKEWITTPE